MHARALPLALLALALSAPVAVAQYSDDPGRQQDDRPGRMRGPGRDTPPDPVVLNGPPAPDDFARLAELPADKAERYKGLYDRFMADTRPQRDSLATLRRDMSGGYDPSDREAFQRRRDVFVPLNQELERRQAAFDDALHDMLDKNEWKRYQKWREEERKVAEQQRRDRWRRHRDGAPADGQPPA
jgi:hypothetical protein